MTAHTLSTTATDTLAAADTDGLVVNSTASADPRVVTRSLLKNRINWGSAVDSTTQGPTFSDAAPDYLPGYTAGDDITVSQIFSVEIACRFTGCRVYKAPNATGTAIPVTLWSTVPSSSTPSTDTGTLLATETIASWAVDGGGWRQVDFSPAIDLEPDTTYVLGLYRADGIYAYSPWVFNAQDTVVWPIVGRGLSESGAGVKTRGNATGGYNIAAATFPVNHTATAYYIDPQIEWDDVMPGYTGGLDYWDQWTHPGPTASHDFMVGIYFADPPYLQDYYDLGVNTLVGGSPVTGSAADYIDAFNAMGNTMDWWVYVGEPPHDVAAVLSEETALATQIRGFHLHDEPDMSHGYQTPATLQAWANYTRERDSTKPIWLNFGLWPPLNQGFGWSPSGASPLVVNEYWRAWASIADVISCDQYNLSSGNDPADRYGVWVYAAQVGKMREISDDRVPVWAIIETTLQNAVSDDEPTPAQVFSATWAALIAGARGIVFFDHRFASGWVTQDFQAMLSNAPMSAMVTALSARLQTLGTALHAADLGLVTAYTSSNTTAGPKGGTFGVPIHYTSRTDGTYQYVFAQAIRPGATTGTLTIPAWAGLTVTVLDESRNETVSGGGVLTDTFAADYQVHLYRRTL